MARINMQLLIPVATAGWGILTWAADRKRERNKERARISALYVNPFYTRAVESTVALAIRA